VFMLQGGLQYIRLNEQCFSRYLFVYYGESPLAHESQRRCT